MLPFVQWKQYLFNLVREILHGNLHSEQANESGRTWITRRCRSCRIAIQSNSRMKEDANTETPESVDASISCTAFAEYGTQQIYRSPGTATPNHADQIDCAQHYASEYGISVAATLRSRTPQALSWTLSAHSNSLTSAPMSAAYRSALCSQPDRPSLQHTPQRRSLHLNTNTAELNHRTRFQADGISIKDYRVGNKDQRRYRSVCHCTFVVKVNNTKVGELMAGLKYIS